MILIPLALLLTPVFSLAAPPDGNPKPIQCVARAGSGESFTATGTDARLVQNQAMLLCRAKVPDCIPVGCK